MNINSICAHSCTNVDYCVQFTRMYTILFFNDCVIFVGRIVDLSEAILNTKVNKLIIIESIYLRQKLTDANCLTDAPFILL